MFKGDFPQSVWQCSPRGEDAPVGGGWGAAIWVRNLMQKPSTRSLYDYWNGLRGARSAPDRKDLDPTRIRSALAYTFILELAGESDFDFRLAGSHLCSTYCRELKGRSFTRLWHPRDRDAMDTLIRAVTEDHAVALVTFQGATASSARASFETILLPMRHNGSTRTRLLGALTAVDTPYWLGVDPVLEQRISGLRLIWPDESPIGVARDIASTTPPPHPADVLPLRGARDTAPLASTVFGRAARRYAHLAVIDGGRD